MENHKIEGFCEIKRVLSGFLRLARYMATVSFAYWRITIEIMTAKSSIKHISDLKVWKSHCKVILTESNIVRSSLQSLTESNIKSVKFALRNTKLIILIYTIQIYISHVYTHMQIENILTCTCYITAQLSVNDVFSIITH